MEAPRTGPSLPPPAAASGSRPVHTQNTVRTVGGVFWGLLEAVAKELLWVEPAQPQAGECLRRPWGCQPPSEGQHHFLMMYSHCLLY